MAQIITITNPLTGQPTKVDQLEHTAQEIDDVIARAKAGGEIDLTKLPGIESTDYPGCYYRMVGGVVEWVNPPMQIGVEYRTTERYLGKPVYVKLVNFGAGPNNTEKKVAHGASNAFVIDYGGYMSDNKGTLSIPWLNYSSLSVSSSDIVIVTTANYSLYNAYVWIKYYKTTD